MLRDYFLEMMMMMMSQRQETICSASRFKVSIRKPPQMPSRYLHYHEIKKPFSPHLNSFRN